METATPVLANIVVSPYGWLLFLCGLLIDCWRSLRTTRHDDMIDGASIDSTPNQIVRSTRVSKSKIMEDFKNVCRQKTGCKNRMLSEECERVAALAARGRCVREACCAIAPKNGRGCVCKGAPSRGSTKAHWSEQRLRCNAQARRRCAISRPRSFGGTFSSLIARAIAVLASGASTMATSFAGVPLMW